MKRFLSLGGACALSCLLVGLYMVFLPKVGVPPDWMTWFKQQEVWAVPVYSAVMPAAAIWCLFKHNGANPEDFPGIAVVALFSLGLNQDLAPWVANGIPATPENQWPIMAWSLAAAYVFLSTLFKVPTKKA